MDLPGTVREGATSADLSPLAWVHAELRRSLESAHKALRRYLREAEAVSGSDVDVVDPAVLRTARVQLHQGVGALELVGLPAAADVLRASEAAVQRMIARPASVDAKAVETIEHASFALLDFLARQLAGKPVSPLMLFPQYRAVQELAGADRVHPADLWKIDWQWRNLPPDASATPRNADDDARTEMETLALTLMRSPGAEALARMSDLCADLGAGARITAAEEPHLATLWQLAAAVFEAEAGGALASDAYAKRVASRLLAQLRVTARGERTVSERLAQDLLFFCSHSHAPTAEHPAPRLAAVRRAWDLARRPTADYETPRLGRHDPAVTALARRRVAAARDTWSAVAGGELHRLASLPEQFALVGESLQRLFPSGEVLAQALHSAAAQAVAANAAPPAPLAMEAATAILYIDASLEDGDLDNPELPERVLHLARRIDDVRAGAEPQPLEAWMEDLYRRVSDRQTMGSVVHELRASLSEVEKEIDQYFRNPAQRQVLIPVAAQLQAMRGVLSVLGLEQASQAVLHMRDDIDALAQTEVDPQRAIQAGTFDRVADNLGALSFLIDMLSVQPALAKSLFRFDPESGSLSAVMGQSERVSAFAAFDEAAAPAAAPLPAAQAPLLAQLQSLAADAAAPAMADEEIARRLEPLAHQALAADQPELARLLDSARATLHAEADSDARRQVRAELVHAVAALAPAAPQRPVPPAVQPSRPGDTGLEDDPEMREIFIEEAREVVGEAQRALERLGEAPDNAGEMTAVRRAFHTLKGSSRMVGLKDFGEAAWACEQLYNARLASASRMDHALRQFTTEALNYLGDWAEAINRRQPHAHNAADLARAADALRLEGQRLEIAALATAAPHAEPAPAPLPQEAVEFSLDLDLGAARTEAAPAPTAPEPLTQRVPGLPSAEDLELGRPAPVAAEAPAALHFDFDLDEPAPVLPELSFDLDLGALAEADELPATPEAPAAAAVEPAASLADLPLDAPVTEALPPEPVAEPVAGGEALEIDLAGFEGVFAVDEVPVGPAVTLSPAELASNFDGVWGAVEAPATAAQEATALPAPEATAPHAEEALVAQPPAHELPAPAESAALEEPPPALAAAPEAGVGAEEEQVKVIGPLRIGIPLFNIYLNEADELSRRLGTELAEWSLEHERHAVPDSSVALAHSLAGSSATVGYVDLSALARALEHALMRSRAAGRGRPGEASLFNDAAEEIRRLLHQFAAGFLRPVAPEIMARLAAHEQLTALPARAEAEGEDDLDAELFPIFEEEADELLPQLQGRLRDWLARAGESEPAMACMRTLHTLKGGARLAGAMRLGERAHRLETAIEQLNARGQVQAADVEPLLVLADELGAAYESLRAQVGAPPRRAAPEPEAAPQPAAVAQPLVASPPAEKAEPVAAQPVVPAAPAAAEPILVPPPARAEPAAPEPAIAAAAPVAIDWSRFGSEPLAAAPTAERAPGGGAVVRVRAGLLDRLVNQAGEVSITRARIDSDVRQLQSALGELTDSLERMRRQLRDIEVQAETQISSRLEAAKAAALNFDPLEMDRYTRFQELTRFMAESVNDVATLQRGLQRTLQSTEDELAAQLRQTRELQDDLLRTRMVEFESLAERLHRTARQAARDTGKQVRLEIVGSAIEVDRGVLERMIGAFEHLLRNSVAHGIEPPEARQRAGKDATGTVTVTVAQAGNEVAVEFADDGGGLDLQRIRERAVERGLLAADARASDAELGELVFTPGFSTAESVTELAGRGVGLDVVRAEVNAMGGRIETSSRPGQGTRFRLLLPLTTAVTQVVMLRCGELRVAVPSPLIELVRRAPSAEVERGYREARIEHAGEWVPFYWLAALLRAGTRGVVAGRTQTLVIVRSALQRVALHVDEVIGNQEVVVKNVGPQLVRMPGLAGVTLLPSGAVALIYNPVALSALYGAEAHERMRAGDALPRTAEVTPLRAPLVMIVDDSLTVRRVTQRLLVREGYRVVTAKDGLEALEKLAQERPVLLLSDIEMPRMDGFDLLRNVRADAAFADLPVVMITSRIAQKHRDYAAELGANHYLGKPYAEEELLALVARYAGADIPA